MTLKATWRGLGVFGMGIILLSLWWTRDSWATLLLGWAYHPKAQALYPRLAYYLSRYPEGYLLERVGQIPLRAMIGIAVYVGLTRGLRNLPEDSLPPPTTCALTWGHSLVSLYYVIDLALTKPLGRVGGMSELEAPLPFSNWILPPTTTDIWLYGVMLLAVGIMGAGLLTRRYPLALVTGFLLLAAVEGLHYTVSHIEHTFFSWRWVGLTLAVIALGGWPRQRGKSLLWWVLGACYGMAALEKLITAPNHWLGGAVGWVDVYIQRPEVATLGSVLAVMIVVWQLSGLALPWLLPWIRMIWGGIGLAFHTGVYLLMGVGGWLSPWLAALVLLLLAEASESVFPRFRSQEPLN